MLRRILEGVRSREPEPAREEGVLWTTRNTCKVCGAPIEDVETAPTAPDEKAPIALLVTGDTRATFCSDRHRRDFLDGQTGRWGTEP